MTTVLAYLRGLSVAEWLGIAAASWLILAVLIAPRLGRMIHRADETQPEFVDADDTRWLLLLPPVPAPRPRQSDLDATWLDAWPTEARWAVNADAMEQERYDRLFDDLIAIEGLQ